jgi:hypothetical protein
MKQNHENIHCPFGGGAIRNEANPFLADLIGLTLSAQSHHPTPASIAEG